MVAANDEMEPLLPKETDETSTSQTLEAGDCCSRLRRWFLIEPVLIICTFSIFPINIISQEYILDWITKEALDSQNISNYQTNATFDTCQLNNSDPGYQFQEYVQSKSSQFGLYESIIFGVPAIFVTIILGTCSDRFGRRFAILPPLVGILLSSSIVTCVISTKASIYWFFLKDVIYGCCGSFYSVLMGCFAYVADRTPPERRMIRITLLEVCMLISGVICPIVLGKVTTAFGYLVPLLFVIVTSAVNLLYVFIFLPSETKPHKLSQTPSAEESTTAYPSSSVDQSTPPSFLSLLCIQMRSMVAMFTEKSTFTTASHSWRRLKLNLLMAAFFVTNLPTFDMSVSTLFVMNSPLCWNVDTMGLFFGLSSGASSVGALIVAPLLKLCRVPDYVIALLAGLASTATSVFKAFVQTTIMMFCTLSLSMLRILFIPCLRSLMSNQVNDHQQGAIFGAIACMEVVCGIIGTTIFNSVYSATLFISTGFVFLVMAAFYAAGSVIVCLYAVLIRLEARKRSVMSFPINESQAEDTESDQLLGHHNDRIS